MEPWQGFSIDDAFGWVTDALERCLPHAERRGVLLLLENHWGLTTFAHDMARIIETIDSPWLQAILDMGNFLFEEDMYAAMARIAPHVCLAHAKTYPGGGSWYSLDLDYARIFRILLDAGWRGYCSIEMEGAEARRHRSPPKHCNAAPSLAGGNLALRSPSWIKKVFFVVLRGPSWTKKGLFFAAPRGSEGVSFVALRGRKRGCSSRPLVVQKVCPSWTRKGLLFFVLRGPSRIKKGFPLKLPRLSEERPPHALAKLSSETR